MNKRGYILVDLLLSVGILSFCVLLLLTCCALLQASAMEDPYQNAVVQELYEH